ncbi:hypothetical protein ACLESD_53410, partial [Pyxidicoccus sp. 3LFB2]
MPSRSVIFRLLAAAPLCALSACASNAASQAEMGALQAEVRTLRESQARLMERLSRLEAHDAVEKARATGTPFAVDPGFEPAAGFFAAWVAGFVAGERFAIGTGVAPSDGFAAEGRGLTRTG